MRKNGMISHMKEGISAGEENLMRNVLFWHFLYVPIIIRMNMKREEKHMLIRKADYEEIEEILEIYDSARDFMAANGNLGQCTDRIAYHFGPTQS